MGRINTRNYQLGLAFNDGDLRKPKHDEIMQWLTVALENQGWTKDRVTTAATRSQRSGFLIAQSAFGGLVFTVSDMLIELGKTVDFDDALRAESAGTT